MSALPPVISYTPLSLPTPPPKPATTTTDPLLSGPTNIIIPRRDLFDVRFQLLNDTTVDDSADAEAHLEFVDAPSDLLPGIYEGGLKTWECSIDLAAYLAHTVRLGMKIQGKKFLEVR